MPAFLRSLSGGSRFRFPDSKAIRHPTLAARLALPLALLGGASVETAHSDELPPQAASLPVRVHVAVPETYLRAGPGADYYPTARLLRGDVVEVWAFDDSGYAAIRPGEGSFSWLRDEELERIDSPPPDPTVDQLTAAVTAEEKDAHRVGVVVVDGAVSRIGSQLNACRHAAQVQLEAGERVTIIDRVEIRQGRHAGRWVRIEPPSGEFRWVWTADLALPPGLDVPPPPGPAPSGIALVSGETDQPPRLPRELEPIAAAPMPSATFAPAEDEVGASPPWYSRWMPQGSSVFEPWNRTISPTVNTGAAAAPSDELMDIELALSLAVAGPQDDWNLTPLRERLTLASARATTHQERLRADALDARLARFESIQARREALAEADTSAENQLRLGGLWSSLSALGSRPVRPGVLPGGAPANGQPAWTPPDAVETTGRLATVVSRRPDAPRWALVDEANRVLVFVTPAESVNLAPLVGQEVSVKGARGYMPEYRTPYLVATEARPRLAAGPASSTDSTRR